MLRKILEKLLPRRRRLTRRTHRPGPIHYPPHKPGDFTYDDSLSTGPHFPSKD